MERSEGGRERECVEKGDFTFKKAESKKKMVGPYEKCNKNQKKLGACLIVSTEEKKRVSTEEVHSLSLCERSRICLARASMFLALVLLFTLKDLARLFYFEK